MSKWQWIVGILIVLGFVAYANPHLYENMKFKVPQLVDSVKLGKSELQSACITEINEQLSVLRKQVTSDTKISLVDYKTFNNKIDAIEYAKLWKKSSIYFDESLKDFDRLDENATIFVGVTKVEAYNLLVQSRVALMAVIVCNNNTILPDSKKQLT